MTNKKTTFIVMIVLFVISLSFTIIGFLNNNNGHVLEENKNHEFYYKGYLWFYDNNKLISKYECMTENCGYSKSVLDDDEYGVRYYKDGNIKSTGVINNKYAFITDGDSVKLYDVSIGKVLQNYKEIKTYNTNLEGNVFILKNKNDLWGAISFQNDLSLVVPFENEFVGLIDNLINEDTISTKKFIVEKDHKFSIMENGELKLEMIDDPIVYYNDNYVFEKKDGKYLVFDYKNTRYLNDTVIDDFVLEGDYIGIVSDDSILVYNDLGQNYLKNIVFKKSNDNKIKMSINNGNLEVIVDGEVIDTISVN